VLIVDDDPASLQLAMDYLDDEKYQVVTMREPAHVLEMARQVKPSVIITDIMMPRINGWEVMRTLKQDNATSIIPIIVLSIVDRRVAGYYLGAADYLVKPINRDTLHASIGRIMEARAQAPVLVVDDSLEDRALISETLQRSGYLVPGVGTVDEAKSWLQQQQPSVIVIDLFMPEMTGFDLLQLLQSNENWSNIPVIVVTLHELSGEIAEQLQGESVQIVQRSRMTGKTLVEQIQLALNRRLQNQSRN
jgi:CheY-like chemotaxis protein